MKTSEIRSRALIDLVGSPLVAGPFVVGITSLMAAWAVDGSPGMTMLGIVGIMGAGAMYVTSMLLWKDDIIHNMQAKLAAEEEAKLNAKLDKLDEKLRSNRDPRDQQMLQDLRHIYLLFKRDKTDIASAYAINNIIDEMFHACVLQLESSYDVWNRQRKLAPGEHKARLRDQREEMLAEVEQTVEQIRKSIDELNALDFEDDSTNLGAFRSQLAQQLEGAKEVESRIRGNDADIDDFEKELSNHRN